MLYIVIVLVSIVKGFLTSIFRHKSTRTGVARMPTKVARMPTPIVRVDNFLWKTFCVIIIVIISQGNHR